MKEVVTLHTMATLDGTQVKYARVLRRYGCTLVGQSVMFRRLTPNQLRGATEATRNGQAAPTALGD